MENEENHVSVPELVYQVSNLPDEGVDLEGEVSFKDLDIEYGERFGLSNPMHYRIHLHVAKQNIIATGQLWADVEGLCDRCAEIAPLHLQVDDLCHTYKNLLGEPIDLTEDVREDILLAFPQSFHCRDDCKGLCPKCGQNLNEGSCDCLEDGTAEDENPWAALDNLELEDGNKKNQKVNK